MAISLARLSSWHKSPQSPMEWRERTSMGEDFAAAIALSAAGVDTRRPRRKRLPIMRPRVSVPFSLDPAEPRLLMFRIIGFIHQVIDDLVGVGGVVVPTEYSVEIDAGLGFLDRLLL